MTPLAARAQSFRGLLQVRDNVEQPGGSSKMCLISRHPLQGAHCPQGHTVLLPAGASWTMQNALGTLGVEPLWFVGKLRR